MVGRDRWERDASCRGCIMYQTMKFRENDRRLIEGILRTIPDECFGADGIEIGLAQDPDDTEIKKQNQTHRKQIFVFWVAPSEPSRTKEDISSSDL